MPEGRDPVGMGAGGWRDRLPGGRAARWLAIAAAVGLLFTVAPAARRLAVEGADRTVDLAPELSEFLPLGVGPGELRAAGASAAVVEEATLGALEARGLVTLAPVAGGTRVVASSPDVAAWLQERLGGGPVLAAPRDQLRGQRVGFWRGDLTALRDAGLGIAARAFDARALADLRGFPVDAVWFYGELSRVPEGAAAALDGLPLGVVEGPEQLGNAPDAGLPAVFAAAGGRAVRVFDPPGRIFARNQPLDTELQSLRAVEDRNLRVLVVHAVPGLRAAAQESMVAETARLLAQDGYRLGRPQPLPPLTVPPWARISMALGIAAACWLAALWLGAGPWAWLAGAASLAYPPLFAALAFPALGAVLVARRDQRQGLAAGLGNALLTAAVSAVGGLYIAAYLADQTHLMEWGVFRGVKLAFVLPPFLAWLAYLSGGVGGIAGGALRLWHQRARAWHLAAAGAVLLVAYVYVLRSGNAGAVSAPGVEVHLRQWLELQLAARPREKEFLVGWPALVLAGFAARRYSGFFGLLLVVGSVGSVSVVDSFAHLRTALATSLARTGYGLVIGLGCGIVAYAVAWAIRRYSAAYASPMPSRLKR